MDARLAKIRRRQVWAERRRIAGEIFWAVQLVLLVCLLGFFLTLWIWQPKAWLFSAFIALCIGGSLYEASKGSP